MGAAATGRLAVNAFEFGALISAITACVTDVRQARIPNALTLASLTVAVGAHTVWPSGHGAVAALGGALTGMAVFFPIFALGGMGAGDVKLMGALGAWVGWGPTIWMGLYTAIAGGVLALVWSMAHGYLRQALGNLRALGTFWLVAGVRPLPPLTLDEGRGPRLPYAVAILAGLLVTIWRH